MNDKGNVVHLSRRRVLGSSAAVTGSVAGCAGRNEEPGTRSHSTATSAPELTPIEGGERETEFLDQVYFGNGDSEGDRVTATAAPVVEGALEVPAREVAPESGEITAELACNPAERTFLTMRLWGGEPAATHLSAAVEGQPVETESRVEEPSSEGRFFYVTIAIPRNLTRGKESIEVSLTAGNDSPDHAYAIYTHVENFYAPPAEETQGSPPDAPEPTEPDFDAMRENLLAAFDAGIENQLQNQRYDDPEARDHGLAGQPFQHSQTSMAENYVRAYETEGSKFQGDEEMIERSLAAFDGYCRAQGYRGVLAEFGWRSGGWIGGPERSGRGGGLQGYSATYMARSFRRLIPILEDRPELLEVEIDNNADGEATVTRREAYTQFWRKLLWENMLPRFGLGIKTFNQDMMNKPAIMSANEVLKFLSPEDVVPEDIVLAIQRQTMGIMPLDDEVVDFVLELQTRNPGEYGTSPEGEDRFYENEHYHWSATRHFYPISPKGTGLEIGSYAVGYGNGQEHVAWISELADDHRIDERFLDHLRMSQHVVVPSVTTNQFPWEYVGAIGRRGAGRENIALDYPYGWAYGAIELDSEPGKRVLRQHLRHKNDFEDHEFAIGDPRHLREGPGAWLDILPALREWWTQEDPTDYRLPTERSTPYAWVDEMPGMAMISDSDGVYYIERWGSDARRRPWDGRKRYHRITEEYRAFGDAIVEWCPTARVETCTVGPYEIFSNRSNTRDVRVEGGPRIHHSTIDADGVVDLITGSTVDIRGDTKLGPQESLVLDRRRTTTIDESPAPMAELTSTSVDEQTREKHWEWSIPEACGADVAALPLDESQATEQAGSYYHDALTKDSGQNWLHMWMPYRPSKVTEANVIDAQGPAGQPLEIENMDRCRQRLLVERPDTGETTVEATAILPTFESYDAWSVDTEGLPADTVTTETALEATVDAETTITAATPVTFTLSLEKPVERVVFVFESNWDTSGLRTVLETGDGEELWRAQTPEMVTTPLLRPDPVGTDEVVNLEGKDIEGALQFKIVRTVGSEEQAETYYRDMTAGASMADPDTPTTIGADWFRRIRDIRIEFADGTATY